MGRGEAKQLIIAGAATEVAEKAIELRDLVFHAPSVEELHWWTVLYSEEWEKFLEAIDRFEEVLDG